MKNKTYLLILAGIVIFNFSALCQQKQEYPFQNTTLPVDERVKDLVSRLTLQEKVMQLFNQAPAIDRLGIPAYNWWNECLHGVARAGKATVFPQAIGMAATFDQDLMFRVGTAISDEARAKHNYFVSNNVRSIYMGLTFWTPNINIFRDPRWGRGQETYGEDPYLTGRMAVNFIKGLQGNDPKYFKVIATAKHYAVHSGPEFSRHSDNMYVNDRDLFETYLPAFKAAIREANVQSIMCAYNRFRDKPCCGSDILLSNILRNQFGFKGYVVSDCGAVTDFYNTDSHHMVQSPSQAWGWSLSAGTDLNCEESKSFVEDHLDEAVSKGMINLKDIDISVSRLFKARFMLGMFDPDEMVVWTKIPMSVVGSQEHLDLSLEVAEKSLVLLKNNGILPLRNIKKIAILGPNANNPAILTGNYNGDPINPTTPLKALKERLGAKNVFYSPGCPIVPGVYTDFEIVPEVSFFHSEKGKLIKGLKGEYFQDTSLTGTPKIVKIDKKIDFYWERSPINDLVDESFGVRWTGLLIPERSGTYIFNGNTQLKIDNKLIAGNQIKLEKNKQYQIEAVLRVAPFWWSNNHQQQFASLSWTDVSRDYHKEALYAASEADVIVFCGGISANLEGEEMKIQTEGFEHGDRTNINLPKIQEDLLRELLKTGKPIVYVNFSGSAIALNWQNENLPAVIQAFYPGETTGTALTRLLFGDFNPSGRLPITFYKSIDQVPDFKNYAMEGRTYRYFKGEPLYEFGYGLSYSDFSFKNMIAPASVKTGDEVKISVEVTNKGEMDGEEVVQLYIHQQQASVPVPVHSLAGVKRVFLKTGETKTVEFILNPEQFSIIDKNFNRIIEPGKFIVSAGGRQPLGKKSDNNSFKQVEIVLTGGIYNVCE
jgi:beta-glucosidase